MNNPVVNVISIDIAKNVVWKGVDKDIIVRMIELVYKDLEMVMQSMLLIGV